GDEAAVDLQRVHGQRGQAAQRGIAGAEVVDGDLHALRAQVAQLGQLLWRVFLQRALDDLDVEAPVLVRPGRHRIEEPGLELRLPELRRGDVHRDAYRRQALLFPHRAVARCL